MLADTRQYMETALWSSTDDDGEPLDAFQFSNAAQEHMVQELQAFCERCKAEAPDALAWYETTFSPAQFAHDFWLTRNRHGAGFWDRDYTQPGKAHLDALTALAHAEGEQNLHLDPDTMRVMLD